MLAHLFSVAECEESYVGHVGAGLPPRRGDLSTRHLKAHHNRYKINTNYTYLDTDKRKNNNILVNSKIILSYLRIISSIGTL